LIKRNCQKKKEIQQQIKADKDGKKREDAHSQLVSNITEGDYNLKKATTVDKTKLTKEELAAQIKAEKEAPTEES